MDNQSLGYEQWDLVMNDFIENLQFICCGAKRESKVI